MDREFLGIDLEGWVENTIQKVGSGDKWNKAWLSTYFELGGKSRDSGRKSCPKNAVRVLYETGRIRNSEHDYCQISLDDAWNNNSKNGVYALLTIEELVRRPEIDYTSLKSLVYSRTYQIFGDAPETDQGAIKITQLLWGLELLRHKNT